MHSYVSFSVFNASLRILIVGFLLALAGCASKPSNTVELTEQEYYQQAQEAMSKNNFGLAIEKLKQLESHYPFGRYAEQAQLERIYAHFMLSDHPEVLSLSERFIRLHPLHEHIDYAYYLRALASYDMGFNFIDRYFSDDVAKRDPTPLRDSFQQFAELIERFPDSLYVADSIAHMVFIRERLASHEIAAARYLMKRHSFIAAANRASNVVNHFQRTPSVAEALALQVEAFRHLALTEHADQALALLALNFPEYHQFKKGKFVDSGLSNTDRRSWANILSFGLFD